MTAVQYGNVIVEGVPDFFEKCWFPKDNFDGEYDPLVFAAFIKLLNGKNIVYSLTSSQFENLCKMVMDTVPKDNYVYGILKQESLGKEISGRTATFLSQF